jgi:CheY-like chemotaxis protein
MSRQPSILLVDDDEDFLAVAERAIQRAELNTVLYTARSCVEAMDLLGLRGSWSAETLHPPDLVMVMMDVSMPGLSGWELLRQIRQEPRMKQLPVVVVSSSDHPDDVERSYALGANSVLLKRFDPRGAGLYLAEAVRYWTDLNQPPGALTGGRL